MSLLFHALGRPVVSVLSGSIVCYNSLVNLPSHVVCVHLLLSFHALDGVLHVLGVLGLEQCLSVIVQTPTVNLFRVQNHSINACCCEVSSSLSDRKTACYYKLSWVGSLDFNGWSCCLGWAILQGSACQWHEQACEQVYALHSPLLPECMSAQVDNKLPNNSHSCVGDA